MGVNLPLTLMEDEFAVVKTGPKSGAVLVLRARRYTRELLKYFVIKTFSYLTWLFQFTNNVNTHFYSPLINRVLKQLIYEVTFYA